MKRIAAALAIVALTACQNLGYSGMTAEQIRATAGTTTCTQYAGLYGKASAIALNQDDTRKGATSKGKTTISCGDATMTIDAEVGVGGATPMVTTTTGTTTTTVAPVKPQ